MTTRSLIFSLTTFWYAFSSLGHQLYGPQLFSRPSIALLEPAALGSFKGNYYGGTVWMAIGAYLHYVWIRDVSPAQKMHARRLTACFSVLWGSVAWYYRTRGPEGVWGLLALLAGLDGLCCVFA